MGRNARVLFAIAALASLFAFAGSASAAYTYKGAFAVSESPGSSPGELNGPGRAAVEWSTGNLFVVDSGNDRVQVFKPKADGTGEYLTQFGTGELSSPWGIAIDEAGGETSVYIADAGNDRIAKYVSDEAATPSFTLDGSFASPAKGSGAGEIGDFKVALAIDRASHELLVADNANKLIVRFEADGTFVSSFDGSDGGSALEGPIDLAVNAQGDVYVIDANGPNLGEQQGTSRALRYSAAGAYKATLGPVGAHERPNALAIDPDKGSVLVAGDPDNVYESGPAPYQPVLAAFDSANQALPSPTLDASTQFEAISGLAIAGAGDYLYVVFDRGSWNGSPYGKLQIQSFFQPPPEAPSLLGQSASATQREAMLRATIDPGNIATSYHFEYGLTGSYGQSTSTRTLPAGESAVIGAIAATGLAPLTTYHYRAVVENAMGKVVGPDDTFTTKAPGQSSVNCPNDSFRAGVAAQLPDCRAYEMVSPPFKNGADILGLNTSVSTRASEAGDRVVFSSGGGFAETKAMPVYAQYLGSRNPSGWATRGLSTPTTSEYIGIATAMPASEIQAFSPDLSKIVLGQLDPPLAPDAAPKTVNLYRLGLDGAIATLTPSGPTSTEKLFSYKLRFAGGSRDFSHIIFESNYAMLPGAVPDKPNLYEWSDGETRLVGILPDDEPAPGGSIAGPRGPNEFRVGGATEGAYTETAISEDGGEIFWAEPATGQLYVRMDGSVTEQISASQRTNDSGPGGADPQGPLPATWQYSTPDGRFAYFTSAEKLTNDATAGGTVHSEDLYAYDVLTGDLTDLSVSGSAGAGVQGVVGASDDGSYVYFVATEALEGGAVPGSPNLYLWHDGSIEYIVTLSGAQDGLNWLNNPTIAGAPKPSRVSTDGRVVVFSSSANITEFESDGNVNFYRFDASSGGIECVSCNRRTGRSTASASIVPHAVSGPPFQSLQPRLLSDDGKRFFFNSPEALVVADTNERVDVYAWEDGAVHLISSGQSVAPSYFADASASGDDVFFATRERLSRADTDENVDLYDARVGGGIAAPEGAGNCQGEDCQPAGSSPPAITPPASSALAGKGNIKPRRHHGRCSKAGQGKKAKVRSKPRCGGKKKQAANPKRAAGRKGGGAR